jgi:hypothetical protein
MLEIYKLGYILQGADFVSEKGICRKKDAIQNPHLFTGALIDLKSLSEKKGNKNTDWEYTLKWKEEEKGERTPHFLHIKNRETGVHSQQDFSKVYIHTYVKSNEDYYKIVAGNKSEMTSEEIKIFIERNKEAPLENQEEISNDNQIIKGSSQNNEKDNSELYRYTNKSDIKRINNFLYTIFNPSKQQCECNNASCKCSNNMLNNLPNWTY